MSVFKKSVFLLLFIALSSMAFGQAASSPFSTFGVGEPYGNNLIQNQGMGGTGVSQPQYWSLNNTNPALLVFNYLTVFQAGALIESRKIASDTISQKQVNGNLNYLVTAFPVKSGKWTTSVGLLPFTRMNYKLIYDEPVTDKFMEIKDTAIVIEQGSGGLNQVFWANGVRIHKNWSLGLKATYLFGSVIRDASATLDKPNQSLPFSSALKEQTYIKDFQLTGGVSFSKDSVWNRYRISAGAVYNLATSLNANKTTTIQRRYITGTPLNSDTLETGTRGGSIYIPASFTVGASLSKASQWSVAAEFTMQDWSKFRSLNNDDEGLNKAWRASIGGELTPDQFAFTSYLKRITYRMGFSYEKSPIRVEKPIDSGKFNDVKDIGINFGFSLPTGRSSLDLAFRIGKRGNKSETILEETYYKVYFGLTFSDQWFIRRKFD
jgi:hypothetical protein